MDTLRSAIQPITHNLPTPIRDLGISIIGDTCYKSLLLDVNIDDQACLKFAVSKAIGIGIVGASSIVKVPQILKLLSSRSASGVSFLSYLLETSAFIVGLAYNFRNGFPFSTYGESALILVQNVVILVLVLNFSGRAGLAALFVAVLAGAVGVLFSEGVLDMKTLGYLQAGAGVLSVSSKLPQIAAIWQQGGTGQLSAFAVRCPITPLFILCLTVSGLQLPRWLSLPHLHHSARGGRQVDFVQLHVCLCPQCHSRPPDGVLLECAFRKGQRET